MKSISDIKCKYKYLSEDQLLCSINAVYKINTTNATTRFKISKLSLDKKIQIYKKGHA